MSNATLISWIDELLRDFEKMRVRQNQPIPSGKADSDDSKEGASGRSGITLAQALPEEAFPKTWRSDAEVVLSEIFGASENVLEKDLEDLAARLRRAKRVLLHRSSEELLPLMVNDAITRSPWFKLQIVIFAAVFVFAAIGSVVVGDKVIDVSEQSRIASGAIKENERTTSERAESFRNEIDDKRRDLATAIDNSEIATKNLENIVQRVDELKEDEIALRIDIDNHRTEIDRLSSRALELRSEIRSDVLANLRDSLNSLASKDSVNKRFELLVSDEDGSLKELLAQQGHDIEAKSESERCAKGSYMVGLRLLVSAENDEYNISKIEIDCAKFMN